MGGRGGGGGGVRVASSLDSWLGPAFTPTVAPLFVTGSKMRGEGHYIDRILDGNPALFGVENQTYHNRYRRMHEAGSSS